VGEILPVETQAVVSRAKKVVSLLVKLLG